MRVAIFAAHFAEYSSRLAEALAESATVLLILDKGQRESECRPEWFRVLRQKVKVAEYQYTGSFSRAWTFVRVCIRVIAFRPNVLHVQEQADRSTARIARYLSLLYPTVLTVHDPRPHSGRDASFAMRNGKFREQLRKVADLFHVHGSCCRVELEGMLHDSRTVVETTHGVILVPGQDEVRAPVPGRILFFGRMDAYKGIEVLLDSAELLFAQGLEFQLILAGRGPELDRLRSRVQELPFVTVLEGYLPPKEATAEFQKASVVVVPYLNATQSGVVSAAIANGRPLVGSRVGGLADAISDEKNGLLVRPGDAQELAKALRKILTDEGYRNQLQDGARQAALGSFEWRLVASTLMEAFQELYVRGKNRLGSNVYERSRPRSKPKMAFFVPGLPLGGAERHSVGLRDRLRERGYETSLIVYGPKRSEIILGLRGAESPVALDRRGMSDVLGWLLVWRVLRQQKADVIFTINQTPAIVAAFVRLFGGTHAKIIGVFHTTLLTPKEETRLFLFKAAARLLDGLVYVSVNQKLHWEARGLRCKVQVAIVNGIDISQYTCFAEDNAGCKEAIGLDGGDYVIGLLATFRPEKNHVQLVHAVAQLRQEGIPAKILFVGGDGPTRKGVIACAEELNVREYISMMLDVNDVRPFVAAFDVGVICSTAVETFSVAALEQLATGVPMVMSDIGGASEIVQEGVNGFLIEPGNTDQLVSRLRTTFDPEYRRQLRSAARASVENFTMDRMVDSYERLALELSSNN